MDRSNGTGVVGGPNRAERFEDEKRRIVESCFSKKDVDGPLIETYITHIRITEYASHPTTPPPPQARGPEAAKPRVIIVAVRKSGRVRMHKSKENANGTFSIGKTWNLDDLSHIESYTGPQVPANHREWGGDTGFLVTIGKPYFWQAQTDKEKKFFIASLIKIYTKYTGGKVPVLSGFDQRELDQVLGTGRRQAAVAPRPPIAESSPSPQPPPTANSNSTNTTATSAPDVSRFQRASPIRMPPNPPDSASGSFTSTNSRERTPIRPPGNSSESLETPATISRPNTGDDATYLTSRSRNLAGAPGVTGRSESRDGANSTDVSAVSRSISQESEGAPPERRRPPMDPSRPQDRDLVPPPLMSPPSRREPVVPPPRSTERIPSRKNTVGQLGSNESLPQTPDTMPVKEHASEANRTEIAPIETPPDGRMETPPSRTISSPMATIEQPRDTNPREETKHEMDEEDDEARPGLGPMIRSKKSKGEIAGAIWKAASAASAFRPRPGGAGDRLRQAQNKAIEGPDGITGVVPAPPRPISVEKAVPRPQTPPEPATSHVDKPVLDKPVVEKPVVEKPVVEKPVVENPVVDKLVPEVKVTVPHSNRPESVQELPKSLVNKDELPASEPGRVSHTMGNDAKYLQTVGVDPTILDSRSEEFGKWLDFFGWVPGHQMRSRNIDEIRIDLERELNKAQAGGWITRFREEDERVDAIKQGIDVAMTECDELDNLLTLYSVELSTLSDDIAYIETQSQGLQVQTANQKQLKKELESLLETCAITSDDLEALRLAPLDNMRGLEDVESSLVTLFRAMAKIDADSGANGPITAINNVQDSEHILGLNNDYGNMRIVLEKREIYMQGNAQFMRRLLEFMTKRFEDAHLTTKRALDGSISKKIDTAHHDAGRDVLWKFGPLMLYTRDADPDSWLQLIHVYQNNAQPLYKNEFQNIITLWRKNAKKMTGEESELLFTSQIEKQQEGVATTARKMTVKRSQTIARALRSPLTDGSSRTNLDKAGVDMRSLPYEVFFGVLDDLLLLVEMEQNFIIDFFHATTLEQIDFPDAVALHPPRDRRGGDLKRHRLMEPDRERAREVTRTMETIFSSLEIELQRLMEWVTGQDPLQGVGVLAILEKKLAEIGQSNQDFLNALLQRLHSVLDGRFRKFVDEQIRAIEETKVKINKRKGVISFIRIFPAFLTAVENMIAGLDQNATLRRTIDEEYDRMLKSMFDSLMVIARENPVSGVSTGSADPEGKEALNFHILLIENMNHFLEETDTRGLDILEEWKEQASAEYRDHMSLYLGAVMRRPLGKLLDHLENIEAQIQTGKSPTAIARQPSNSKTIFNKILSNYDSKEVRKGIEALRKRVDKHFGDADDPALSRGLVAKVLKECEGFYNNVESRIGQITTEVYGGDVSFEWPRADVKAAFR